ncbi:hypothetical protein XU18_2341 [Perkinsela sp. CCAP 1560/4]|nr:hypothetical protein XU18_2341 [Perkinsela sp. CCAP 1560/4]|eukprot:KNH06910.1 hypothetical protein XU18_2341 [Perkinsela sp. CCAP 1560/4]
MDKILSSSMKETITGLCKTESWVRKHQLTTQLNRVDHTVKQLDYLLGSTPSDSEFAQRQMSTRNSVLRERFISIPTCQLGRYKISPPGWRRKGYSKQSSQKQKTKANPFSIFSIQTGKPQ